jgi:alcohol dehydrogenase
MINDFNFSVPQTIQFGMGSLKKLPELVRAQKAQHVFLVSDRGIEQIGLVKKVQDILKEAALDCHTYLDVTPNPAIDVVEKAAAAYEASGCKCIIALGGGAPMDTAKAIGILAQFGGKLTDYEGLSKVPGPIVPLIAIPTTAGTGSEVSASAVITDPARNFKFSIIAHEILPKVALLDPELIMTAPPSVASACGLDALIHATEAYVSRFASPYTDAMAEKAMSLIGPNLRAFVANRQDKDAACAMMLGSTFAAMAFAWAKLGDIHAMSHPVSAYFHVAHGVANAILMPAVTEYNALADKGRYEVIYNYIREEKDPVQNFRPEMLVEALKKLNRDLNIPEHLKDVGVTEDKFEAMAEDALKAPNTLANPRQTTKKDFIRLYQQAF